MKLYFVFLILLCIIFRPFCSKGAINPLPYAELTHTQLMFEWNQIFDADSYLFQISIYNENFDTGITIDTITRSLALLVEQGFGKQNIKYTLSNILLKKLVSCIFYRKKR